MTKQFEAKVALVSGRNPGIRRGLSVNPRKKPRSRCGLAPWALRLSLVRYNRLMVAD
jgi:hypothetical protein